MTSGSPQRGGGLRFRRQVTIRDTLSNARWQALDGVLGALVNTR
jgi:hypothetical protein